MTETEITDVRGRRVWDSRGLPTVEVEIATTGGATGRGCAPAGASTGRREAVDRRDETDFLHGRDVTGAVASVNTEVRQALLGADAADQGEVDRRLDELDPTRNRRRIGGNVTVATSLAVWKAAAAQAGVAPWQLLDRPADQMPRPEVQILGGGAHAGRRIDLQDVLVIPMSATTLGHALLDVAAVYHAVGDVLEERGLRRGVADEGGFWPEVDTNEACFEIIIAGIERAGLTPGEDAAISIDVAASEFFDHGRYVLAADGVRYDRDGWLEVLTRWTDTYPIIAVEDPVDEDDDVGMRMFTDAVGDELLVIGDDYLVTRDDLVDRAAGLGAGNAALIKVNQVGTVTGAHRAVAAARRHGWQTVVSARSGETEDTSVAHLAVGWAADLVKVGSISRGERTAKWNELLRISEALGDPPLAPLSRFGLSGDAPRRVRPTAAAPAVAARSPR